MTREGGRLWTCPPGRVLAAIDFGEASASAIGVAGYVASAYGATLSALHAERFEAPPYFTLDQIARLEAERRDAQARAVDHLRRFAAEVTAYPIDPLVVDEPPAEAILHAAGTADLMVMGTHGRRGPGRWWLGSVAERVVRHAPVPVLVTRAGAAPAGGVFERLLLLGEAVTRGAARECVDRLAGTFGSTVTRGGPVAACGPDAARDASLVVVAIEAGDRASVAAGEPETLLAACARPVLFIPVRREIVEERQ